MAGGDFITNSVGNFGLWHFIICVFTFIGKFHSASHLLSIIFLAAPMEVTCGKPTNVTACDDACKEVAINRSVFEDNIISEFGLTCDKSFMASFSQSLLAIGIMVGSLIFGITADRWGRRPTYMICAYLQLLLSFCISLVPTYWLHIFLRFLQGVVTGGAMNTSFVIVMEIIGPRLREIVAILYQFPFSLGHASLPLIAFNFRHWRKLYMCIAICHFTYLPIYCTVPETARWLFSTGQLDKASEELKRGARINRRPIDNIDQELAEANRLKQGSAKKAHMADLFRTPTLRFRTLIIGYNWLSFCLCYYGVSQYVTEIMGDIFTNVLYSAVLGGLGILSCIPFTIILGRRLTAFFSNLVCGLCILPIALTPKEDYAKLHVILASFGIYATSINFGNFYLYSGELFPTVARNSGMGFASLIGRLGTIAAPTLVWLARFGFWIPSTIFALCSLVAAITVLFLPETRHQLLPETIEDAENFGKKD